MHSAFAPLLALASLLTVGAGLRRWRRLYLRYRPAAWATARA